jgi:KUP system potassium uptake protein
MISCRIGFVIVGVIVATSAAIIASQAMIAGSFTLIGEALRLNLWPKMKVKYPSEARGQLFIPVMNLLMFLGCAGVVLYFRESSKMEAAYGLAIIITMIATTILFANYMVLHRVKALWIYIFLIFYLVIELTFLAALSHKFLEGGYITMLIAMVKFLRNVCLVQKPEDQEQVCGVCAPRTLHTYDTGAKQ